MRISYFRNCGLSLCDALESVNKRIAAKNLKREDIIDIKIERNGLNNNSVEVIYFEGE